MLSEKAMPEQRLGREVVGTTLKVYLYLLKVKHASAREVYKSLEMSSPYLATYHLDKLNHLKLVSKDVNGSYHVIPKHFGILRFFVVTGKWVIPRTFFYTILFASVAIYLLFSLPRTWNVITFILVFIAVIINLVETVWFYRTLSKS